VAAKKKKKGKPTPGAKKKSDDFIRSWLEKENAYTLHRQVKKRLVRNPCAVTNVMDVWECELLDVQAYAKYNDNYRYILSVIDVFRNFYI